MEYLINRLKEKSLKVTPQRVAIAQTIQKSGHVDIDEIYSIIVKSFPTISLATLYKNINSFLEKNFIVEVPVPNHKTKYELVQDSHAHFICTRCGSIKDISLDENRLLSSVHKDKGLGKFERYSFSLYGNCCSE
jgi:Fur family peroxide stress response transcriptional regulator